MLLYECEHNIFYYCIYFICFSRILLFYFTYSPSYAHLENYDEIESKEFFLGGVIFPSYFRGLVNSGMIWKEFF